MFPTADVAYPSSALRRAALVQCLIAAFSASLFACAEDRPADPDGAGNGGSAAGSGNDVGRGAAGKGGSGSSDGTAGTSGTSGAGAADSNLYGYFNVVLNPVIEETGAEPNTSLLGKLYAGESPSPMAWQLKEEAEDCKLYTPMALLCQPACSGGALCVSTNMCMPYPPTQTVGSLTVKGLGSSELMVNPIANSYQLPAGTKLPYPPCSAGSKIELAADGGEHAAFTLAAECVAPVEAPDSVKIANGQPLALNWTAAKAGTTRIGVLLDISQHGISKGKIECDTTDDGSLSIPAKLVDALVELGISGFPTVVLTRTSASKAADGGPPNVKLNVSAPYRSAVEIPGLTSCTVDADCPDGRRCQKDLKCE
jgi:hypothetical protein